ncbi:MAG: NAD(P)H-hydrate epimerase [Phycisphaerae bacterium]|nr:NAD(P)H-hydrate epimerase [Phycisphaerae bacterium]
MSRSLTRDEVRRVDGIAIHELGIPGVVLMENAGRNAADRVADLLRSRSADRVAVFAGPGNNGGDGFVIARHLLNRGIDTRVFLVGDAARLTADAGTNHRILRAMGVEVPALHGEEAAHKAAEQIRPKDIVVDALLGTGSRGDVREPLAGVILAINAADKAGVVAVDVPSGLDCDTGRPANATIRADRTVTFVASKTGFAAAGACEYTGEVFVADIGAPPDLIERVSNG